MTRLSCRTTGWLKLGSRTSELKARVFTGGAWLGAGSISEQGFRFTRNVILARLLAPSAFGMMVIVLSAATLLQSLSELGVKESLIQNRRGSEREYVNAAWWIALSRALFIYAAIFAVAPWVGRFYNDPELIPLLRVANLSIVLEGAISSRAYIAMKEMKFHRWALTWHGGAIIGITTTIVLAFFVRSVWALVIGACAESFGRFVMSYIVCPHVPTIRISFSAARDLLTFSRGLFGLSILSFIFMRADVFVLGKLISPSALGYYTLGIAIAQVPGMFVLNLLVQIFLPTLSHVRDDQARSRRIILRVAEAIILLGTPGILFLWFCGRPLLTVVYGPAYAVSAVPLAIASVAAIVTLLNGLITLAIYAAGVPRLHRRCVLAMAIVMVVLVYPLSRWLGPMGAQVASVAGIIGGFLLQLDYVRPLTGIRFSDYGGMLVRATMIALGVGVAFSLMKMMTASTRPMLTLTAGISVCVAAYVIAGVMLARKPSFANS